MYPNLPMNGEKGPLTHGIPPKYNQNPLAHSDAPHGTKHFSLNEPLPRSVLVNRQVNYVQIPATVGPESAKVVCPSCGKKVDTIVKYQASKMTHLYAILMGICLFFVCGCFIPYCVNSCQDASHRCPNCDAYLASFGNV